MSENVGTRQHVPDELRGLALLGIVVVNVPFIGSSLGGFGAVGSGGPADRLVEFAVTAFAQGKFYLLFAFLFGYSAALMMRRPGRATRVRFARRLVGLGVLGVLHALLFFVGDILLLYAVVGSALLLVRSRSDRFVLRVAAFSAALAIGWLALVTAAAYAYPSPGGEDVFVVAYDSAMASGSFDETVAARWSVYGGVLAFLATLNGGLVLSMFCLGLVAGRRNVLAEPDAAATRWRACRRLGLWVGLPGGLLAAALTTGPWDPAAAAQFQASGQYVLGIVIGFVTAPALTAGYLGGFLALRGRRPDVYRALRPAGRMSLTLYIGESVLLAAVFCGWGLGWFGQLGAMIAVGVGAWLVLDVFAHLWSRRFAQEPLEWWLRWWTTRDRPRLLRSRGPERSPAKRVEGSTDPRRPRRMTRDITGG